MTDLQMTSGLLSIVIAVQSFSRFHSPPSNRSTTTAVRYYTAALFYCLGYVALFAVLTAYPSVVQLLAEIFKFNTEGPLLLQKTSAAVTLALLVGTILPNTPLLRDVDAALRRYLQERALIGFHAFELGRTLFEGKYAVPAHIETDVRSILANHGLETSDLSTGGEDAARSLWIRIVSLMRIFETLDHHPSLASFKQERRLEFAKVLNRYKRLEDMATTLFRELRESPENDEPKLAELVASYEKVFAKEAEGLWRSICYLVSQGALSRTLTVHRRRELVNALGYQSDLKRDSTADFVAMMFVLLLVSTVAVNVVVTPDEPLLGSVKRGFLVVCSGLVSIVCAWLMRVSWGSPHLRGHLRPIFMYLLAGGLATVIFVPIRTMLRAWMDGRELYDTIQLLLLDEWPFLLITFAGAAGLAYCLDNAGTGRLSGWWLSLVEAVGLAVLLVGAAMIAVSLRSPGQSYFAQTWALMVVSAVHGLFMGTFVPAWRRSEERVREEQTVRRYAHGDAELA